MTKEQFEYCPLCGSLYASKYNLPHTDIVCCTSKMCGLTFAKTQPSDEKLHELYNALYYIEGDEGARHAEKPNSDLFKFKQHFSVLDKKIGLRGKRVLDYGCGIGNFLEVAQAHGVSEAMGVEVNERAREIALRKGLRVEEAIAEYNDDVADIVYMNDVIEHLRNPVDTLREIRRVLAPNGVLFVVTMNINGLKARLLKKKWDLVTDPTHFYFYDFKSLCKTLKEAGFNTVSEERFVVNFSHHGLSRRILQRALVNFGLDTGLKLLAWSQN